MRDDLLSTDLGERLFANEQSTIDQTVAVTLQSAAFAAGVGRRLFHPKPHGCLDAIFKVNDDIPGELVGGIFQVDPRHRGIEYPAKIRFSNGDARVQDDTEPDIRGMAIKLNISKLSQPEKEQDFVLANNNVFFSPNPDQFKLLIESFTRFNGLQQYFSAHPELGAIFKASQIKLGNPLNQQYFSQVPFLLRTKSKDLAVKYSTVSVGKSPVHLADVSPQSLCQVLVKHFEQDEFKFVFMVQVQTNPSEMPVEDPTEPWDETKSPFIPVATITIPKQAVGNCEGWSFNPWHALEEHRPLGAINRIRQRIYAKAAPMRNAPKTQRPFAVLMTLKNPSEEQKLIETLNNNALVNAFALQDLGLVHFARFLLLRDEIGGKKVVRFAILTEFDFDPRDYVDAFVDRLGDVFDELLAFMEGAPQNVRKNRQDFQDYIARNSAEIDAPVCPPSNVQQVEAHPLKNLLFYSAYPHVSVQNILDLAPPKLPQPRIGPPPDLPKVPNPELPTNIIQGIVGGGYGRMKQVCHFVLEVKDPAEAKKFIKAKVEAQEFTTVEKSSIGRDQLSRPSSFLNIGFTFNGLAALNLQEACALIEKKPELQAFVKGAVGRAAEIGDVGESSPGKWKGFLGESARVHVLLSLYAESGEVMKEEKAKLQTALDGAFEMLALEGATLKDDTFHFGFKDGMGQPNVRGLRKVAPNGGQPEAEAGDFILGYPSQSKGHTYDFEFPADLGKNGTFAAFRILRQDVAAFEEFLYQEAQKKGVDKELIAAELCGRWRDGTPLALSPDAPQANPTNDFNYTQSPHGGACPVGAHIRRVNPRDSQIAGGSGSKHRLIRLGMPYGPEYDREKPNDGLERGLLGLFIGVSLRDQFEFIMKNWINRGGFQGNVRADESDPLIAANGYVTTKGSMYCFIPSIEGLNYIASH